MQPDGYALLAPILRSCVLRDDGTPMSKDPHDALAKLRSWVEAELAKTEQVVQLSEPLLLENLRSTASELVTDAVQVGPTMEGPSTEDLPSPGPELPYRHFDFIHAALCEPPTSISLLARSLQVGPDQVRDWLLDEPVAPTAPNVASRLLALLVDLCGEPEDPQRVSLPTPLERFDQLVVLGGLRQAFPSIYRTDKPKLAQAVFIPPMLTSLLGKFQEGSDGRLCVVAPTNGGKNGIILAAALLAIAWDEGPVLVLQPYRAQIAESLRTWRAAAAGRPVAHRRSGTTRALRVAGSSALISDLDPEILNGRIDITAIIPEKLAVLSRHRDLKRFCQLLIVDEIGLLVSSERGAKLEIILTLAKEAGLPILAAGAALSELASTRIARWLADLASDKDPRQYGALLHDPTLRRDPPIDYWVWRRDGKRRFWKEGMRPSDDNQSDTTPLPPYDELDAVAELLLRELTESPERQILVFIENREHVIEVAELLAKKLRGTEIAARMDEVADDEGRTLRDIWLGENLPSPANVPSIIEQRVGIHTRDVPSNNLERIEESFRRGRLRVLCATTTVEAGINLPVDTVVQVGLTDHAGRKLSPRALEQRLGRSGRTIEGRQRRGKGIVYIHDASQHIDRVISSRILKPDEACESGLHDKADDGDQYRALLLLAYLGSPGDREGGANERTEEDLRRVLGCSYWAHGLSGPLVESATTNALKTLQKYSLVERWSVRDRDDTQSGWKATHLGRALAAALLLPRDAPALAQIVASARSGVAEDDQWLPEVLYAACQVPTIMEKDRRPRFDDVIVKGQMRASRALQAWVHLSSAGTLSVGFPKAPRMRSGVRLGEALERAHRDGLRSGEADAILRAYVAYLWTRGDALSGGRYDVGQYVKNLNEHVVKQDLAYYLSHVLRAAGWLAQYEGTFLVGLRLRELSRQVELGVPIQATTFFATCGQHFSRQEVASVRDGHYRTLLAGLDAALALDLAERLDRREGSIRKRLRRTARDQRVVESDEKLERFDRMGTADDLCARLRDVWDPAADQQPTVIDGKVQIGPIVAEFTPEPLQLGYQSDADLVISAAPLPEEVAIAREPQPTALLGVDEFVVLATHLAGLAGDAQVRILNALAAHRAVCYGGLVSAVAGDSAGGWNEGSTEELGRPLGSDRLMPRSADRSAPVIGHEDTQRRDDALAALGRLTSFLDQKVTALVTVVLGGEASYDGARDDLRSWRDLSRRAEELRRKLGVAAASTLDGLIRNLNELGAEALGEAWERVP